MVFEIRLRSAERTKSLLDKLELFEKAEIRFDYDERIRQIYEFDYPACFDQTRDRILYYIIIGMLNEHDNGDLRSVSDRIKKSIEAGAFDGRGYEADAIDFAIERAKDKSEDDFCELVKCAKKPKKRGIRGAIGLLELKLTCPEINADETYARILLSKGKSNYADELVDLRSYSLVSDNSDDISEEIRLRIWSPIAYMADLLGRSSKKVNVYNKEGKRIKFNATEILNQADRHQIAPESYQEYPPSSLALGIDPELAAQIISARQPSWNGDA